MNLQQLRDKEITMDRPHNAGLINDHIENTIAHFLQSDTAELEPEGDWAETGMELIKDLDGDVSTYVNHVDANYYFVGGIDIWLVIDYGIEVWWDGTDYPEIRDVVIDKCMCYWMDMEFDLKDSELIVKLLVNEIQQW